MSNLASRLAASESASSTIRAKDRTLSCDTRQTGLNNNALVIGPSGAGKKMCIRDRSMLGVAPKCWLFTHQTRKTRNYRAPKKA